MPETTTANSTDILDEIVRGGRMAKDEQQIVHARDLIGEFAQQVLDQKMAPSADVTGMIATTTVKSPIVAKILALAPMRSRCFWSRVNAGSSAQ